jgi:hypothetical protein
MSSSSSLSLFLSLSLSLARALWDVAFDRAQTREGATLETVVRLADEALERPAADADSSNHHDSMMGSGGPGAGPRVGAAGGEGQRASEHSPSGEATVLIDAANNLYVLARPRDTTVPYEDAHLLFDVVRALGAAWAGGAVAAACGLPTLFGAIGAGMALGPSGLNTIRVRPCPCPLCVCVCVCAAETNIYALPYGPHNKGPCGGDLTNPAAP